LKLQVWSYNFKLQTCNFKTVRPANKPNSVSGKSCLAPDDDHSSGTPVARRL